MMENEKRKSPYYIFVDNEGELFIVGKNGSYEKDYSKALAFINYYEALCYAERHGFDRIGIIRQRMMK